MIDIWKKNRVIITSELIDQNYIYQFESRDKILNTINIKLKR